MADQQQAAPRTNLVSRVSHARPVVVLEDQAANAAQLHTVSRKREGSGLGAVYTPVCTCGWTGRRESESNDWCYSNLRDQEIEHLKGGAL